MPADPSGLAEVRFAEGPIRAGPCVAASATSMLPQTAIATVARAISGSNLECGGCLCRLAPRVPMVQPAQPRHRDYLRIHTWPLFRLALVRRVLRQRVVEAIFVVIVHVIANQPTEMWFVERDDVIEDFSPTTSHPSFRRSILPGRLYARPFGLQSSGLQEADHFFVERRISIEDDISIRACFGECLAQLLDHPFRCRVVSHIEVQNPAPPVLDHEKAVKQSKCHRRHREEIERGDHLAVIV
jgi:hypothetical protein